MKQNLQKMSCDNIIFVLTKDILGPALLPYYHIVQLDDNSLIETGHLCSENCVCMHRLLSLYGALYTQSEHTYQSPEILRDCAEPSSITQRVRIAMAIPG